VRRGNRDRSEIRVADLFANGRRLGSDRYLLILRENGTARSRYRVIVGKRYGNAVLRNRIRRRIREILRTEIEGIVPGVDLLFLPRRELHTTDHPTLKSIVIGALSRAQRSIRKEDFN
jgi:ribonuclease P protein component